MKKSLMMLGVAAIALASCTNEEVMNVADSRAIGFTGTGIDNITKGDITSTEFNKFTVFGGYDETPIFNGTVVTNNGGTWTYNPTVYWVKGTWNFGAYAADGVTDGITAQWDYNTGLTLEVNSAMDKQADLVYADVTNIVVDDAANYNTPVSLNFTHLLSKVAFKFTKDAASLGALKVEMSNFKVAALTTNAKWVAGTQEVATEPATGDYTDALGEIDATNGVKTEYFYVIPQNVQEFVITANAVATDAAGTEIKNGTITAKVPTTGITKWDAQNQYLYTAQLSIDNITDPENPDPKPIEFTGSAEDWTDADMGGNGNITVE